ncbi:Uncharacterised protein [Bordetella ansorpii]|uniref:Uncharacterized protein n=1 Tax=Bordetella ansorpii TaxID=288768 RepID=A0A157RLW8_9BORD|nr:hypothetical protein [Bordetella ansorpii]SAI58992.1 Uncharacterised protein [Bordetella ansorpii]
MSELLSWIEGHPGVAAWVQAAGAILAIVVGFWHAARSRRHEREAAEERAWNEKYEHKETVHRLALNAYEAIKDVPGTAAELPGTARDALMNLALVARLNGAARALDAIDLKAINDARLLDALALLRASVEAMQAIAGGLRSAVNDIRFDALWQIQAKTIDQHQAIANRAWGVVSMHTAAYLDSRKSRRVPL